jgi:carboxyl-terminal processing protease
MHIHKKLIAGLSATLFSLSLSAPLSAKTDEEVVGDKKEAYDYIKILTEVLMQVRHGYVDQDETEYKDLVYGALSGMLKSLDPHSQFMPPKAYDDMKEETSGKFSGVGIVIGMRKDRLTVISPIEDTPAWRAGIESDDLIIKIDGEDTTRTSLRDAVGKLRGDKNTKVVVTIQRDGEDEPLEFEITRDDIKIPSVKGTRMINDQVGYLRITQFNAPTADNMQAALDELFEQGMKGLVIDLRSNPGGLLKAAIQVSEKFLRKNQLIVSTRGPGRVTPARAGGNKHYPNLPIAILINRGSASASEIVAGCLQDHKRAILVGQRSFGKGSVQSVMPISDGAAIRLTTARYYTPSERVIHDHGIEPDIYSPVSPQEWRNILQMRQRVESPERYKDEEELPEELRGVVDTPLLRAVEILSGIIIFVRR